MRGGGSFIKEDIRSYRAGLEYQRIHNHPFWTEEEKIQAVMDMNRRYADERRRESDRHAVQDSL